MNLEAQQFRTDVKAVATNILSDVRKLREEYDNLRQQQELQQQLFDITLLNTIKSIKTASLMMTRGYYKHSAS